MPELNYEEDMKINPNALDVEWLEQAELMRKYAKHAADMKAAVDEAKERLDVGRAKIEMEVRADPASFNLAKPTEAGIQSTILLQNEYAQLTREYAEARYEYEIAVAAVRAVDQRKTALENLVRLLIASYFAGPEAPRDLYQEHLNHAERKKNNAKVRISRKGRDK
jgi:hypothetical protein